MLYLITFASILIGIQGQTNTCPGTTSDACDGTATDQVCCWDAATAVISTFANDCYATCNGYPVSTCGSCCSSNSACDPGYECNTQVNIGTGYCSPCTDECTSTDATSCSNPYLVCRQDTITTSSTFGCMICGYDPCGNYYNVCTDDTQCVAGERCALTEATFTEAGSTTPTICPYYDCVSDIDTCVSSGGCRAVADCLPQTYHTASCDLYTPYDPDDPSCGTCTYSPLCDPDLGECNPGGTDCKNTETCSSSLPGSCGECIDLCVTQNGCRNDGECVAGGNTGTCVITPNTDCGTCSYDAPTCVASYGYMEGTYGCGLTLPDCNSVPESEIVDTYKSEFIAACPGIEDCWDTKQAANTCICPSCPEPSCDECSTAYDCVDLTQGNAVDIARYLCVEDTDISSSTNGCNVCVDQCADSCYEDSDCGSSISNTACVKDYNAVCGVCDPCPGGCSSTDDCLDVAGTCEIETGAACGTCTCSESYGTITTVGGGPGGVYNQCGLTLGDCRIVYENEIADDTYKSDFIIACPDIEACWDTMEAADTCICPSCPEASCNNECSTADDCDSTQSNTVYTGRYGCDEDTDSLSTTFGCNICVDQCADSCYEDSDCDSSTSNAMKCNKNAGAICGVCESDTTTDPCPNGCEEDADCIQDGAVGKCEFEVDTDICGECSYPVICYDDAACIDGQYCDQTSCDDGSGTAGNVANCAGECVCECEEDTDCTQAGSVCEFEVDTDSESDTCGECSLSLDTVICYDETDCESDEYCDSSCGTANANDGNVGNCPGECAVKFFSQSGAPLYGIMVVIGFVAVSLSWM